MLRTRNPSRLRTFLERANDRGVSLLWTAVIFMFLTGSAALAIDASGSFNVAQTDQTTADLACLGGAPELPDTSTAISLAYSYATANWPEMAGLTPTIVGDTATYADGAGNQIYIDAAYNGDSSAMYVGITEVGETYFGKTIGQNSIMVSQEAACSGQSVRNGTGMLPIGALAGTWNGDLFDCAAKVTGNCGALAPDGTGANAYRDAVANGIQGSFVKHWGNNNIPDADTLLATINCFANPCNVAKTEPGNMVGPWNQGLQIRFNTPGGACLEDGWFYNCTVQQAVFGGSAPVTLQAAVTAGDTSEAALSWQPSIYGDFADALISPDAKHYYYNGDTLDCDSPRLATVPIVNKNLNWDLGDAASTWPNGRKNMKFIGFYTIYINQPATIADLGGPMNADIIWFGPNAECSTGEAFQPFGSTAALDLGVKLVAP